MQPSPAAARQSSSRLRSRLQHSSSHPLRRRKGFRQRQCRRQRLLRRRRLRAPALVAARRLAAACPTGAQHAQLRWITAACTYVRPCMQQHHRLLSKQGRGVGNTGSCSCCQVRLADAARPLKIKACLSTCAGRRSASLAASTPRSLRLSSGALLQPNAWIATADATQAIADAAPRMDLRMGTSGMCISGGR